jgi:NitT/TauT family transport system permease protein
VAFFPMMINTISGLRSADEEAVNLMTALTANKMQILWMLRFPMALPYIMAGLEIALTFSLLGTIVAEFLGANAGLGMLLTSMNFSMDVAGEFSVLLLLSVVGLLLNSAVSSLRSKLLFWDSSTRSRGQTIEAAT